MKKRKTVHSVVKSHPLGIRPRGNLLALGKSESVHRRKTLGPFLGPLADDLIVAILQELDSARDLLNVSHTCKALYAFGSFDELWKQLVYARKGDAAPKSWRGTWRATYWSSDNNNRDIDAPLHIDCTGYVYSDFLYRPFQCANIDYANIIGLSRKMKGDGDDSSDYELFFQDGKSDNIKEIPIFSESTVTAEWFENPKDKWHSRPFIINLKCPAARWSIEELENSFGDVTFHQEYMSWSLRMYFEYMRNNQDESPLYLFDCKSEALGKLSYQVPVESLFGSSTDYFELMGPTRPDHRWLIIGPERSGSSFHKDPNGTSAWNSVVSGTKYWIMFPPGHPPPGVSTNADESEVSAPVSVAEWFLSGFYNQAKEDVKYFHHGLCKPGQAMYVPAGWWHLVVNVTGPSIAMTGNFVPRAKLPFVLDFLKNKKEQISGFCDDEDDEKDMDEKDDLKVYEQFVTKLKETYPDVYKWAMSEIDDLEAKRHTKSKWDVLVEQKSTGFSFAF